MAKLEKIDGVDEIIDRDIESSQPTPVPENPAPQSQVPPIEPAPSQKIIQNCNTPPKESYEQRKQKYDDYLAPYGHKIISKEEEEKLRKSDFRWKIAKIIFISFALIIFAYLAISFSMKSFSPSVNLTVNPAQVTVPVNVQVNITSPTYINNSPTIILPKELSDALLKVLNSTQIINCTGNCT